jgi:hypothetical protein
MCLESLDRRPGIRELANRRGGFAQGKGARAMSFTNRIEMIGTWKLISQEVEIQATGRSEGL